MTWEQRLSQAGFRITEPRRAVMKVLQKAEAPLSPRDVLALGDEHHPRLGLTTVYRTIALLRDLDLVRRVHRSNGCQGYVAASSGHRHHVICTRCGRTVEFPGSKDVAALIAQVERNTDFQVDDHLLQLFGLCPECQQERI